MSCHLRFHTGNFFFKVLLVYYIKKYAVLLLVLFWILCFNYKHGYKWLTIRLSRFTWISIFPIMNSLKTIHSSNALQVKDEDDSYLLYYTRDLRYQSFWYKIYLLLHVLYFFVFDKMYIFFKCLVLAAIYILEFKLRRLV